MAYFGESSGIRPLYRTSKDNVSPSKLEVGQILQSGVLIEIVRVVKDEDGEVGGIPEDTADFEASPVAE